VLLNEKSRHERFDPQCCFLFASVSEASDAILQAAASLPLSILVALTELRWTSLPSHSGPMSAILNVGGD